MGQNVVQKLLAPHLPDGEVVPGEPISIRVSQTLAHDRSGPLVLTHFEKLGIKKIQNDIAVFYVDHDIVPSSPELVARQAYLQEAAHRVGAHFSRPGNGMCHLVHLERFAVPGRTLIGAESHTQLAGAAGMLALAGEAVEVAAAMAGELLEIVVPEVVHVLLHGKARPFVSPKDIALELIRRVGFMGLAGKALEFNGPGARALGVYERATIASMGPYLGAVTTVFPSDEKTRIFLQRQRRSKSWRRLEADADAEYQDSIDIELGALEPLVLCPPAPGQVRPVREIEGKPVTEVLVGSCTNGSARDILTVAAMVRGKKVHRNCTLAVSPGSRQVLEVLAREGSNGNGKALADLISCGARILESGCGPCVVHHSLSKDAVSVRTFPHLSCGAASADVYVVSPETAAACAINGQIVDPRKLRRPPKIKLPRQLPVDDAMIVKPGREAPSKAVTRLAEAPSIAEPEALENALRAEVVRRVGHKARLETVDYPSAKTKSRAPKKRKRAACLVAGKDFGYVLDAREVASGHRRSGLRVVIAEGFAPPCELSLANAGVVPLRFRKPADYSRVKKGDEIVIRGLARHLQKGEPIHVSVAGNGVEFEVSCELGERGRSILVAGGLLGYLTKDRPAENPRSR